MNDSLYTKWTRICLLNLLIVTIWGVLMRYKIAFEFPYIDQKSFQLAHSNFAFSGWISLTLMMLMIKSISDNYIDSTTHVFQKILSAYAICAWGILISFSFQAYGPYSVFFSIASIGISFWFCIAFFYSVRKKTEYSSRKWFIAALLFNIVSSFGTLYLCYAMFTHTINQHSYLSSFYWLLHFQYNGWFFFACGGLFFHYLQKQQLITSDFKYTFWLFAISCIPAYGLSVLWLDLPTWLYTLIVISACMQFIAWVIFIIKIIKNKILRQLNLSALSRLLLLSVAFALSIKLSLQLGSTIPSISKLAFGFRPIVIAYLHLVLLAFTTVFLLTYIYINDRVSVKKNITTGLIIFTFGVLLNELVLSIQGIFSFSYTLVPYTSEILLGVACIMLAGVLLINRAIWR